MRIFLTGATGYIGSAVLDASLRAGHEVTALVRDPEKAERVSLRGVQPVLGDLAKRAQKVDRQAIESLIGAAIRRASKGHAVSFVYTSGTWVLGNTSGASAEDA